MTPQLALQSEIFRTYAIIVFGVLVVAGLALALLKWGFRKNVTSIWLTYRSWLVMAPLILGCVFAGRVAVIVFTCLLAGWGLKEFARATGLYGDWWMTGAAYLGIVAVGVTSLVSQPHGEEPGHGWYGLFIALPVYAVALILLIPILRNKVQGQLQYMSLAIVGFIYIGWMFGHLAFLANATNAYGYLLYILFATELNDVAAFTCGKLFGKRQFRSNISPKKTWGGALGALAVSTGVALAVAILVSAIWNDATDTHRFDRGHRRPARRPGHQRDQTRYRHQRHGRGHSGTRRRSGPH